MQGKPLIDALFPDQSPISELLDDPEVPVLDVGWSCPRCEVVLAPSVSEHRCAPPSAGVTTASPQLPPFQPTSVSISPPTVTITAPATIATTGHLGVAGGYLTELDPREVYAPRLSITGGAAA